MHECSRRKAPGHIPQKSPAEAARWRTEELVKVNKCAYHRYWINSVDKPSTRQISLLNSDIFVTCNLRDVSAGGWRSNRLVRNIGREKGLNFGKDVSMEVCQPTVSSYDDEFKTKNKLKIKSPQVAELECPFSRGLGQ